MSPCVLILWGVIVFLTCVSYVMLGAVISHSRLGRGGVVQVELTEYSVQNESFKVLFALIMSSNRRLRKEDCSQQLCGDGLALRNSQEGLLEENRIMKENINVLQTHVVPEITVRESERIQRNKRRLDVQRTRRSETVEAASVGESPGSY